MKYIKNTYLKVAYITLGICLFSNVIEAQTLVFNPPHQSDMVRIEKGTRLQQVLDVMEQRYNVVFLYRTDTITNHTVQNNFVLPSNVEKALRLLLKGQKELDYKYLNPKTYGIFTKHKPKKKQKSVLQEVSGTVTDASTGNTMPGVNVVVKGTTIGASTDEQGQYTVNAPSLQDTLVFSFIGYKTQEIPINGRTQIDVAMQTQTVAGEELVVVGYGTQQEQQITGSVSNVDSEEFVSGNVNNASELIQGKVPGLTISSKGGNPNADPTIRLRGVSSFSSQQEPLVVVDGIIGASMDNLDPNDIKSISVLKDASASAIYGTRGASGVIVVTTKSGVRSAAASQPQVSYNGSFTVIGIENRLDVLSGDQFRQLAEETGFSITDLEANTDWFKEITQTGYNHIHNLAISGGNESTNYRISGNFRDNTAIQRNAGFEQINGRLNLSHKTLNDNLDLQFNLAVTNREESRGFPEAFRYAATFNPTAPVRAEGYENTGGYKEIASFDVFNPVAIVNLNTDKATKKLFTGALRAEYDFSDLIPGLSVSGFYSLETISETNNVFFPKTSKFTRGLSDGTTTGGATQSSLGPGIAQRFVDDTRNELFEVTANYAADISDLQLESVVGYSYNTFEYSGTNAEGGDFISDAVKSNNLGFAQDFDQGQGLVGSYLNTNKLIGFFGRISLNWDDTYFVTSSIRREGSTRFGENQKYGTFWSAGAGIELTSLVEMDFFDRLKIRSSYGVTGRNAPFDGISKLRFGPDGYFFVNGNYVQSFGPVSNPNPNLKWEESHEFNVGIDFTMLDSRLSGTVEYYKKNTKDLLFEVQVPVPPNLFPTRWENVGELENTGIDASLNFAISRGNNLNWDTGFTFSKFNTTLSKFVSGDEIFIANAGSPGQNSTPLIRVKQGAPIGQIWGPEFAGIGEDGEWRFFNSEDEKVKIDEITREDEQVLGNGLPDFSLGWNNTVNYKNWSLRTFFRGVFGHQLVNTFSLFYETPSSISTWNVLDSAFKLTELTSPPTFSSYNVEDASFVRFQNASLGYTVPLPENSPVQNLHLSISGNNLFTITGYDGIDPEVSFVDEVDGGPLAPGIERRNNWFTARSVTFGVNIDF